MASKPTRPKITPADGDPVADLMGLGFSQYEARIYVALVSDGPLTGYAVAQRAGVPPPKVYEVIKKLQARDAVMQLVGKPTRFLATAPDRLLGALDERHSELVAGASKGLHDLRPSSTAGARAVPTYTTREAILALSSELIARATRRVYLSATARELEDLAPAMAPGEAVGVEFQVLSFGPLPSAIPARHAIRHASTDGIVYRHHQARHVAVVVDSEHALWALAPSGKDWSAVSFDDHLLVSLVKGYIRHDMYFQRAFADFGDAFRDRYGENLASLTFADPPRSQQGPGGDDSDLPETDDRTIQAGEAS